MIYVYIYIYPHIRYRPLFRIKNDQNFLSFLYYADLRPTEQNMRSEENIDHIVRDRHSVTSLS